MLRPSEDLAALLLQNARNGHFVAYTHTEQDVIETVLTEVLHTVSSDDAQTHDARAASPPLACEW